MKTKKEIIKGRMKGPIKATMKGRMKKTIKATMNKVCFIILLSCVAFQSRAQGVVKWEIRCEKISGKTYEIHFTPKVQESWHIYSLGVSGWMDGSTSFSFKENPLVILKGGVKEIGSQEDFVQRIKLKTGKRGTATILKGIITFMACNDEQCMPPQTIEFKCEAGRKSTDSFSDFTIIP